MSGGRDPGHHVFCVHDPAPFSLRAAGGRSDRTDRPDPHCRGVHRLRRGCAFDAGERSLAGAVVHCPVSGAPTDRGQPHLSPCGGLFRGTALHLGAGSRDGGRQSHGHSGNAGVYSPVQRTVRLAAAAYGPSAEAAARPRRKVAGTAQEIRKQL